MLTRQEVYRKLLHLIALLMPIGIFYLPKVTGFSLWTPPLIMAFLSLFAVLLEWGRLKHPKIRNLYNRCFQSSLRKQEEEKTTGATFIIGGAAICAIVFVNSPYISFTMLTLFILGDAAAALVGIGIGRIQFMGKTLEGSLACFVLCILMFILVFPHLPFLVEDWGGELSWPLILTTSMFITLFELIPIRITKRLTLNDNLYVPVMTGLIMQILISSGYF